MFILAVMFIVLHAYLIQCHITHLRLRSLHQILHTFVYIMTVSTHNGATTMLFTLGKVTLIKLYIIIQLTIKHVRRRVSLTPEILVLFLKMSVILLIKYG